MQGSETPLVPRDKLASRIVPEIALSKASNPLTASISLPDNLSPSQRAARRFAIEGNAIVTGGAGYLGRAAIKGLLEHGASGISIFDLPETINASRSEIEAIRAEFPAGKIVVQEVDVTDNAMVESAVEKSLRELGTIDMLLCFAGVVSNIHALDVSPAAWRRVLEINTTGSWSCAQAVASKMISQGSGGSIIFISSIAGHSVLYPQPQVAYNVSKAGVLHLTKCLAIEWAQYGIRVNSISPGYMNTILNAGDGIAEARNIWASRNPMGRMGEPDELSGAVVLLCSKIAGRYITGEDITVDGGGRALY